MSLICVHGRAQAEFSQDQLLDSWSTALALGGAEAGINVSSTKIKKQMILPYYAKELDAIGYPRKVASSEETTRSAKSYKFRQELAKELVIRTAAVAVEQKQGKSKFPKSTNANPEDFLRSNDPDDLTRNWLNSALTQNTADKVDKYAPKISRFLLSKFVTDVDVYLNNPKATKVVNGIVRKEFEQAVEPLVVIGHSLGSVVAFNVLTELKREVELFVTVGSPLAVRSIRDRLNKPVGWPKSVKRWINAADPTDLIAMNYAINRLTLFSKLDTKTLSGDFVINYMDINNTTDNRHGISGYLNDPVIARSIVSYLK